MTITHPPPALRLCGPAAGKGRPSPDHPPSTPNDSIATQAAAQRASGAAAATPAMTWPEIEQMVRDLMAMGMDLPDIEYFVRAGMMVLPA